MTNYVDIPDDLLPMHSLNISSMNTNGKFEREGDLPANRTGQMHPPSTLTPRQLALQSSMMTTLGLGGLVPGFVGPDTPSQTDDFSDFVNIPPSPAQNAR